MNSIQIALAVIAGVCFYVGIYHALVGLRRRPVDGLHILFALMSFSFGVLAFGAVLLHPAVASESVAAFLRADRWSLMGQLLGTLLLLWFVAFYTNVKPYLVLVILSVPLIILMWSHLTADYTFLYSDVPGFFEVALPWGEPIKIADVVLNSRANQLLQLTILAYGIFVIYAAVRQYRRGERREALLLGLAMALLFATYINDFLLDLDLITSIYALPFGYVAMIVVMSLILSNEIIDTEQELETLNLELEQRVADRTSELSAANRALQKAKDAAEAANRAKSVFLANMSHELRTPLNAILGFTQLMKRDPAFPPNQEERLNIIDRSGEHLLELINDVLEMSKIEAGHSELEKNAFDLHHTLESLESIMRIRAENKGLDLILERATDVPRYVNGDERKLRQVLINLLGNAIKFTNEGRVTLEVKTKERQGSTNGENGDLSIFRLVFKVSDTGVGIVPEEIDRLFEPFSQTRSGQQVAEGTGLGLPISRQFVELMGGEISVQSTPISSGGMEEEHGSTFSFDVLLEVADPLKIVPLQPVRRVVGLDPAVAGPYRILVVDDSADNRALLCQLLASVGFEVQEAINGQQALERYESWQPQLIWMDIRMPVMDGYQAAQAIRESNGPETVIIAITASAFEEERVQALAVGCDDFVRKPFREDEIFKKMAEHLGLSYIYETLDQADAHDDKRRSEQVGLTPDALGQLPASWVTDLRQAAMHGHIEPILNLINQLGPDHSQMARALSTLARDFQFGKIVALTEQ